MALPEPVELPSDDDGVRFAELPTSDGGHIGRITLAAPKTLNALTLGMIDAIAARLDHWAGDAGLRALWIEGEGDRALCAGGDIQALYRAMKANHDAGALVDDYAETFFEHEYRLDFRLHTWPTPVLCWGQGVVMGGGLGFFSAASHRIVGEKSRLAMPEITIGLFPDAGGTAFLCAMPEPLGLFLGLTGAHVNGADALWLGVATHGIGVEAREATLERLTAERWSADARDNRRRCDAWLNDLARTHPASLPPAQLPDRAGAIAGALGGVADAGAAAAALEALGARDEWLGKAVETFAAGCPMTAAVVVEQLGRGTGLSLAEKFRLELVVGTACARHTDFAEGVRALLIDKDRTPRWRHPAFDAVPREDVQAHFTAPWAEHPLSDLED